MTRVQFIIAETAIDPYTAWGLVLSEKDISPPRPRIYRVPLEGRDGTVDLSEWTGQVRFEDRTVRLTFSTMGGPAELADALTQAQNALLGRRLKITLSTEPDSYYDGRCEAVTTDTGRRLGQLLAEFTCAPYRLRNEETVVHREIDGSENVELINARMPVIPVITVTAAMDITFDGAAFSLSAGTHRLSTVLLQEGRNTVGVTGTGSITFTYREGVL